jgi:monoterpene epsilon-lactone hydrolase
MKFVATTTPRKAVEELINTMALEMSGAPMSLEDNRRRFDERGASIPLPPGMTVNTVTISDAVSGELLSPPNPQARVVLYFHGGGLHTGSSLSHRPLCARIAALSRWHVLSVNYRLAPEYRFPCAVQDAVQSYSWLLAQGHPTNNIVFAGDSAGGGLALAALLSIADNLDGQMLPMPAGAIGISPWLDLDCSSASYEKNGAIDLLATRQGLRPMGRQYAGNAAIENPLVSPFYADKMRGLCPMLLQVGSAETLHDEVESFARRARGERVDVELQVWENMIHVWHSFTDILPESELALQAIAEWLNRRP